MSIIIKTAEKPKKELISSGTHIARCYSMICIGTQNFEYQGESKKSNRIRLIFELPHEIREFNEEKKPLVITKEYTLSLHEKSNLRKDLESWRGQAFTSKELNSFDLTKLLGIPCNLSIIHKESNSGKPFAFISNISKLSKGVECPELINEIREFNFTDKFDIKWLEEECPTWIQEQIKSSDEYKAWEENNNDSYTEDPIDFHKELESNDGLPF
jgi:hypothetical protein